MCGESRTHGSEGGGDWRQSPPTRQNSAHPELGVDFLRFMTSREMAGTFAEMRDVLVAVNGAMEGRTSEDLQDLVELAQQASTAYGTAPGEGFPEMDQFLNDVRFKIVNGQITPEEGAKELESAAEAVRNRSQHPDQIIIRHLWKPALLLGLLALAMGYWLYTTARQWRERRVGQAPRSTSTVRLGWGGVLRWSGGGVLHALCGGAQHQVLRLERDALGWADGDGLRRAVALPAAAV